MIKQTTNQQETQRLQTQGKTILIFMIFISALFLMEFINASTLGSFKKDECANLHQICDNCTYVNLTSVARTGANSTIWAVNSPMTKIGLDYNYTFCNTTDIGDYLYNTCGDKDGTITCENIAFSITGGGFSSTDARTQSANRGSFILFGISVLMFVAFLFTPRQKEEKDEIGNIVSTGSNRTIKYTFFILSMMMLMLGVNVTFISIYNDVGDNQLGRIFDTLAMGSTYFFWFMFFLLLLLWMFSVIISIGEKRRLKDLEATGGT